MCRIVGFIAKRKHLLACLVLGFYHLTGIVCRLLLVTYPVIIACLCTYNRPIVEVQLTIDVVVVQIDIGFIGIVRAGRIVGTCPGFYNRIAGGKQAFGLVKVGNDVSLYRIVRLRLEVCDVGSQCLDVRNARRSSVSLARHRTEEAQQVEMKECTQSVKFAFHYLALVARKRYRRTLQVGKDIVDLGNGIVIVRPEIV